MAKNYYDYISFRKCIAKKYSYQYRYLQGLESVRGYRTIDVYKSDNWYNNPLYTNEFLKELEYFHNPKYIEQYNFDSILELFSNPL